MGEAIHAAFGGGVVWANNATRVRCHQRYINNAAQLAAPHAGYD